MTLEQAKQLKTGDRIIHSGFWAGRTSEETLFEVITTDDKCVRVSKQGYVSRYEWSGAGDFVTRDFFEQCKKEGI